MAAYAPSFFDRYPDWPRLTQASTADLELALAPIGLQARRAASLKNLARAVVEEGIDPGSREAPGIGQYISRAIAVATRNEPVPMVDSNWVRVMRRVFAGAWTSDYRYDPRLQSIAHAIVEASDPRSVNWAMLDLGATICLPRTPRCSVCPLESACEYGAERLQRVRPRLGEE